MALTSCGSGSERAQPVNPSSVSLVAVDAETIVLQPATLSAGGELSVQYVGPLAEYRGGFFLLSSESGERVAVLWLDKGEGRVPGFSLDDPVLVILDFPVRDAGPDHLVLPPDLKPGRYSICTANTRPIGCGTVEVI